MPLTVHMRLGAAPDYIIDPEFLGRYIQTVKWAVDDGMIVMVNLHHDSWSWAQYIGASDDNGVATAMYKAVWTQLANAFKDFGPEQVCFESLNEPTFTDHNNGVDMETQIKRMEEVNKMFHEIIRNSGGNNATRMLILTPNGATGDQQKSDSVFNTITALNDPNILSTFHFYSYWPFSVNICGNTKFDDPIVVNNIKETFDIAYNTFVSKGIGVVIGEYGLYGQGKPYDSIEHGEELKYFEYVNYYANLKGGMAPMLWDNSTFLNRTSSDVHWKDPSIVKIIQGTKTSRSSYSDSDMVFLKDQDMNKDVSIKLILNGNTFKSIYNGSNKLVNGIDYTYSNGTISLKKEYINKVRTNNTWFNYDGRLWEKGDVRRVFTNDGYGIFATLTLKFSAGADWDINLSHYTTPTLNACAPGTIQTGIVIPTSFNGSRVSTMEAYPVTPGDSWPFFWTTGSPSWTNYKEFDNNFIIDYYYNKITIPSNFFNETQTKGGIILRFDLLSGEKVDYTIMRDGDNVTFVSTGVYSTGNTNNGSPSTDVSISSSAALQIDYNNKTITNIADGQYPSFILSNIVTGTAGTELSLFEESGLTQVSKDAELKTGMKLVVTAEDGITKDTYSIVFNEPASGAVYFSDKNLENAVRAALNQPAGVITNNDVLSITSLDLQGSNIASLGGLQYLTNLEALNLDNNIVNDITEISALTKLQSLSLENNGVQNINPLSTLTNLTTLNLNNNVISDVTGISGLSGLTNLDLGDNCILDFTPLSGLTNLAIYVIDGNPKPIVPVDKTSLTDAIQRAQTLNNSSVEGIAVKQYCYGSKTIFQAAINNAMAASYDNTILDQSIIDSAVTMLNKAITEFKKQQYTNASNLEVSIGSGIHSFHSEFLVPIVLRNVPETGIATVNFSLEFNSYALQLQGLVKGDIVHGEADLDTNMGDLITSDRNVINIHYDNKGGEPIKEDGVIAYLKFRIPDQHSSSFDINLRQDLEGSFTAPNGKEIASVKNVAFTAGSIGIASQVLESSSYTVDYNCISNVAIGTKAADLKSNISVVEFRSNTTFVICHADGTQVSDSDNLMEDDNVVVTLPDGGRIGYTISFNTTN